MMEGLIRLPALARDLLTFWSVLVCLGSIICAVRSFMHKNAAPFALSALCFTLAYIAVRVRKKIWLYSMDPADKTAAIGRLYGEIPWILWPAALLILTAILLVIRNSNRRFTENSITPLSIKTFWDEMPCGICYFRQDGQVIFSNRCVNGLCIALTGRPLIDGNALRKAITEDEMTVNGRTWHFSVHGLSPDGEDICEMIASDRTELHKITETLREDNEKLGKMNSELRRYNLEIDDIVRRQEILQAKIDIHDEMNRMILSAATLGDDDTEELERVFRKWQRNLKLLGGNAEEGSLPDETDEVREFAKALGIRLNMSAPPPELTDPEKDLLFMAAREAIANAAKHARADHVDVLFEKTVSAIRCRFQNGGILPKDEIRFTGGLRNLKELANGYRAEITAEVSDVFTLRLTFPRQGGIKTNSGCKPDEIHVK